MEKGVDLSKYLKGSLRMPEYDLLTFREHTGTEKLHLFRSTMENEEKCNLDELSLCDEKVHFNNTDSTQIACKSEETILKAAVQIHLKGKDICGVCMSRIYARNWQY